MDNSKKQLDDQLSQRQNSIQNVFYIVLGLNLLVLEAKFSLGLGIGLLSLLADALHSFSDSAKNVLGLIAKHLTNFKPDWDRPYGYSKFESLSALGIAGFLIVAGIEIVSSALKFIFLSWDVESLRVNNLNFIIMIGVLLINVSIAVYEAKNAKVLQSKLLQSDAQNTLSKVWVTIFPIIGMLGIRFGCLWLDIVLALILTSIVFWRAWKVIRNYDPFLSDRSVIPAREIMEIVMDVYGVLNCHSISSRGVIGQEIFIEMYLVVIPQEINAAYEIVETVKRKIREKYGLVHATIQLETC